jgi:hypothetical protein
MMTYLKFSKFLEDFTKHGDKSWEHQAIKAQAIPMLEAIVKLVMLDRHKLEDNTVASLGKLIVDATGLNPVYVADQIAMAHDEGLDDFADQLVEHMYD